MHSLLKSDGNWFKGNLHAHTTCSDGRLSPEEVIKQYRKSGYDFLALTDHWVQSETKCREELLLLGGCEWDTGDMIQYPIYHIVGIGMNLPVKLERIPSQHPQVLIDAIRKAGGIPILAHPAWSLANPTDCLNLEGLGGVEIYNSLSNTPWNGRRADSGLYIDLWASRGKLFNCMAADDSHFYTGEQTRSFLLVNANELSADSIKKAILKGDFYASQGPEFHSIIMDKDRIEVTCSPVQTIVFYSNTVWCSDRVTTGGVTSATYQIKPTDQYVRIELIDAKGNMAWCSPFSVNQ